MSTLSRYTGPDRRTYLYLETGDDPAELATAPHTVDPGDVVDFGTAGVIPADGFWESVAKPRKGDRVVVADNSPVAAEAAAQAALDAQEQADADAAIAAAAEADAAAAAAAAPTA